MFRASNAALAARSHSRNDLTLLLGASHVHVAESDLAASTPRWLAGALGGRQVGGHVEDMRVNLASDESVHHFLRHCNTEMVCSVFC